MSSSAPPPAAILLAAGSSERMGVPKALLPCPPDGTPLVRAVAHALQAGGASPVFVVVAPGAAGEAVIRALGDAVTRVKVIINPTPERGMLSSIQAGLHAILALVPPPSTFLVSPCDLPRLKPVHVQAVIKEGQTLSRERPIAAPVYNGKRGHPTLFKTLLAAEILNLNPEEFGLNEVVRQHAADVVDIQVPDDAVLRDADTPEEWRALTGVDLALPG